MLYSAAMSAKAVSEQTGKEFLYKYICTSAPVQNRFRYASVTAETNWDRLTQEHPWLLTEVTLPCCGQHALVRTLDCYSEMLLVKIYRDCECCSHSRKVGRAVMQKPLENHVTFTKCIYQVCTHMHLQSQLNLQYCIELLKIDTTLSSIK